MVFLKIILCHPAILSTGGYHIEELTSSSQAQLQIPRLEHGAEGQQTMNRRLPIHPNAVLNGAALFILGDVLLVHPFFHNAFNLFFHLALFPVYFHILSSP